MKKVFIDGSAGTTGLRIYERLLDRDDITVIQLAQDERKNPDCRKKALNDADIAFLCLPDDAAKESVAMIENPETVVIDTSTAHRTAPGWAYGFPELGESFSEGIQKGKRIAVPGCHASGFIALVYPLIEAGMLSPDTRLFSHSVTGYSGGGKKMIADYEADEVPVPYQSPRQYALTQNHKHLREMQTVTKLTTAPVFCPVVSGYYSGIVVTVPLFREDIPGYSPEDLKTLYKQQYQGPVVSFSGQLDTNGFIAGNSFSGLDTMHITVEGNEDRLILIAAYDNLGKGASGAAVECMNLILGKTITKGLCV